MKTLLALDLELEQSNSNKQCTDSNLPSGEKIIQVGFVVFTPTLDGPKFLVEEVMNIQYDRPLSTFIKALTTITDEQVNSSTLTSQDALKRICELKKEYQFSGQVIEWGSGSDFRKLVGESGQDFSMLFSDYGLYKSTVDVKALYKFYAFANNLKGKCGLSRSMGQIGINFPCTTYEGKNKGAHWALTDAKATAIMYTELLNRVRQK